ncbi:MAG: DegT/DnrJ/EryC1/StrS family aminotransferase [Actinomycetota bacterium]|nr:DegT/DnrJ/EryC1/StrS family aminotransferase [Actinomycetota bacterium]
MISHSKACITEDDNAAVTAALESGLLAAGTKRTAFETALRESLGMTTATATDSGTSALFLLLKALKIGRGDEVIVPTYVCHAVRDAIVSTGACAVLCDVSSDWCLNVESVRGRLSSATKAVVAVHMFGISAGLDELIRLGVPVIEDLAQALGGRDDGVMLGRRGIAAFCSFNATKLLCTGEGGMAVTSDRSVGEQLRNAPTGAGSSLCKMSDLQAVLGLAQLSRYPEFLARRQQLAEFYFEELAGLPLDLPHHVRHRSIFFRFPVQVDGKFEALRREFERRGVHVRRGVDALLHREFPDATYFEGAEQCFSRTLSLPLYPALSDNEAERVVEACKQIFNPN